MNQTARAKLLLALIPKMAEVIDAEIGDSFTMAHIPDDLAALMAQAAVHVIEVVMATEQGLDDAGMLAVDENGVAVR